jgi:acyl-CoA thioesterase I
MGSRFCTRPTMFRRTFLTATLALAAAAALNVSAAQPVILVVGDSISAGYGLPAGTGWVTLLQQRLTAGHYPHTVVNASISGDTTAGGRVRFDSLLERYRPAVTVIELGGNDGLRGGSVDAMRQNLDAMTAAAQKAGSRVLVVGMRMPPNYGAAYVQRFDATFAEVARARKSALVAFLFEGFGDDEAMFQADRIHPTVAAQPKLLDNVWRELKPLLDTSGKTG